MKAGASWCTVTRTGSSTSSTYGAWSDGTHLEPWAAGARDVYVRIAPTQISGRRISADAAETASGPGAASAAPGLPTRVRTLPR